MAKGWNIIRKYYCWNNTLRRQDAQEIETKENPVILETHKDARRILEAIALKEGMQIYDNGLFTMNARKETTEEDEETGIVVEESESLRIEKA